MNSRQRLLTTLNHQEPDHIPLDLDATQVTRIHHQAYEGFRQSLELPALEPTICDYIQGVTLLGNVAPLDLGVRGTPEEVYAAAMVCLQKAAPGGGMILSFGGGVSPGTKPQNIDALLQAARDWDQVQAASQ
jgi:uroporphyrinogen-III decarboxylase